MAGPISPSVCESAMRALVEARWPDWHGLPADCTLATLEQMFGEAAVLDAGCRLGDGSTICTRSNLSDAPILVWHAGQDLLLVECDLAANPAKPPAGDRIHRLDTWWGAAHLEGGEWVMPERGLALVVTPEGGVLSCLGFAPSSFEHFTRALRPRRAAPVPLPSWRTLHQKGTHS